MKHLLACLALCASLSASAQGDNCTVLGIQDLTQMVFQLQTQLNAQDAEIDVLQTYAMWREDVIAIAIHKELTLDEVTGGDLSTINLSGAYLAGVDLSGANLTGANLASVDLGDAILTGANLGGAYLGGAYLGGANLTGVDLEFVDLTGATMTCLRNGCPSSLPSGYTCEPDPDSDCSEPDRYRIVLE